MIVGVAAPIPVRVWAPSCISSRGASKT